MHPHPWLLLRSLFPLILLNSRLCAFNQAIARKLQEREMKEERKRQKQMETTNFDEYYDDKGV